MTRVRRDAQNSAATDPDAHRIRVMVTLTVQRGGEWGDDRTLTIGGPEPDVVEDWLREFPRALARALAAAPDEDVEDEPQTAPEPMETAGQVGLGL